MICSDDYISSEIPCGFKGCDCVDFFVNWENSSHLQCVDLICLECKNMIQVSLKNYYLMANIANHILFEAMEHGIDLTKEEIRKAMIRRRIKDDA